MLEKVINYVMINAEISHFESIRYSNIIGNAILLVLFEIFEL